MYTSDDLFDQRSVIAAKLEELLKERQITKSQLCKETGVTRPTIDKLLSGTISSKANFDRHMRKILGFLQLTPDKLMGNSTIQCNHIRTIRQIMRTKIEDIASATGYSVKRLKEIEAGEEPTTAELRDIALFLDTGTRCIVGDGFFEPQFSRLNDFMHEDGGLFSGCCFWGHLGILPVGSDEHVWFPITGNVHMQIHRQMQRMKRIVVPCMNNKVLLLNLENIKLMLLLDEACNEPKYTNWDSGVNCGNIPLVLYEALDDYLHDNWDAEKGKDQMSAAFHQAMENTVKEEGWDEDSVEELQQTIVWYRDGKKTHTRMNYQRESSIAAEIEMLYGYEDDQFAADYLGYEECNGLEILINMKEVTMVELPLVQVEEAICDSLERRTDI